MADQYTTLTFEERKIDRWTGGKGRSSNKDKVHPVSVIQQPVTTEECDDGQMMLPRQDEEGPSLTSLMLHLMS
ncbi:hypothetical protein ElyMa_000636900 [Elysia marginata]|uniref:Uncharacterized protein n=1 Tax=Elysia marginata TaxID=1093978 RepID=A0AAV4GAT6_9GAST|nr:hypothetical protein ElyMa_000636900 [Elysia marginata]